MNAIDWFSLFPTGLWVLGLASALAAVSYADWRRRLNQPRRTLRQALAAPSFQGAWSLGMALFCAGLALGGGPWWQTAVWAALTLAFVALGGSALLRIRRGVS